jgi:hypothetical protein
LFRWKSGKCVTIKKVNKVLAHIFPPKEGVKITGHCFRSGLISSAGNLPDVVNDTHLKGWGRWRTDTFLRYEFFDMEQKKYIAKAGTSTVTPAAAGTSAVTPATAGTSAVTLAKAGTWAITPAAAGTLTVTPASAGMPDTAGRTPTATESATEFSRQFTRKLFKVREEKDEKRKKRSISLRQSDRNRNIRSYMSLIR